MNSIFLVSKKNLWSDRLYSRLKEKYNCSYFNSNCYEEHLHSSEHPDWIFFFHWSEIVPERIYKSYKCVTVHTGNLPKYRGGSPIQNQIIDGVIDSNVNAIVMGKELDAGDVYCSLSVTLQGSLSDIWLSIADRAYELILKCIISRPVPTPQRGAPSTYKRIKNNEINLNKTKDLCYIYDQIRMVDAEGYPNSYLNINGFRFEFTRAKTDGNSIISDVRITKE